MKVTGGAWGTSILQKTLQFRNCSGLGLTRYETCFKIYLKCQCRIVYVVKSEQENENLASSQNIFVLHGEEMENCDLT